MTSFELVEPHSLEEAFGFLDREDPAVRPVGGGTALMLMMKAQFFKPVRLVSLRHIGARFSGISLDRGWQLLPHRGDDDLLCHGTFTRDPEPLARSRPDHENAGECAS